ncbi:MAG: hypothetical protein AB1384_09935 [Actinomycetota bacterium]
MKEKIKIPGPAKVIYATYLSALAISIYLGFNNLHPFLEGWRYPWQMSVAQGFGLISIWIVVLTSVTYIYYATLGRPTGWNEPLGWYRIVLALLAIWYFLLSYAVYLPNSWMKWLNDAFGGIAYTWKVYDVFLWVMLLANVIYIYARWTKSRAFPRFRTVKKEGGV